MLKEQTTITITQNSEGRSKVITFDFCHAWEYSDNWEELSSKGKITFPKKVIVIDEQTSKKVPLYGTRKFVSDMFRRGDKVKIESRYIHWNENLDQKRTKLETIVDGYITKVNASLPIELEIEDNMYILKQTPMTNGAFKSTQSIESILKSYLEPLGLTVNMLTTTNLVFENSLLTAENETVAQFLAKLRKDYFLKSYFRGNELRIGALVYVEEEAVQKTFAFEDNIISSELKYNRKDDVVLSAVASNHITEVVGQTKQGVPKTKSVRLEVLVTFKNDKITSKVINKNEKADPSVEGERRTLTYPFAKTVKELTDLATEDLKKYYYSGFKGKFTTFGTPYIHFGDNSEIINPTLPEQNGIYKVKGVDYSGGVDGYRQTIELDYKLNI